jgi:eukaryotic-like serine/threonine-protein kinase
MPDLADRLQAQFGATYVIQRELGGGGMSRVFLARDTALARDVVVKVLPPDLAASVSAERFRREIMLAAALNHPNIVPVLHAGEIAGLPYFLMPFIRGESLRARLNRGPLALRETISILKDVARALAFAHERGIIHRDVKPDNILLAGDAATVTDFGVAKAISASRKPEARPTGSTVTGAGISLGTPAYMAPEQALADPNVTHRADIYALGVVGYEMLVGVPPFHGRSAAALLTAHVQETPPPIEARRYDVPRPLVELIMECLEKEPDDRPTSGAHLVRALDDTGISAGHPAVPKRRLGARRWPWLGGATLLLAAGVAWLWSRPDQEGSPAAAPAVHRPASGSIAVTIRPSMESDQRESAVARSLGSDLAVALSAVPGYRIASQPLGVDFLMEGTVQREQQVLRVNLRFIDATRDSTMWTVVRQGSVDSVLALQDSVSHAAAAALRSTLLRQ